MSEPVPSEYDSIMNVACNQLVEAADKMMWVTEMLGNDKFVLDTNTGFRIEITKKGEQCGEHQDGQ